MCESTTFTSSTTLSFVYCYFFPYTAQIHLPVSPSSQHHNTHQPPDLMDYLLRNSAPHAESPEAPLSASAQLRNETARHDRLVNTAEIFKGRYSRAHGFVHEENRRLRKIELSRVQLTPRMHELWRNFTIGGRQKWADEMAHHRRFWVATLSELKASKKKVWERS